MHYEVKIKICMFSNYYIVDVIFRGSINKLFNDRELNNVYGQL